MRQTRLSSDRLGECWLVCEFRRSPEFIQKEMRGKDDQGRQCHQQERQPRPAGHPRLRRRFAEAAHVIHIHGGERIGQFGARRGQKEIAEQHRGPGQNRPRPRGAAVITEFGAHK